LIPTLQSCRRGAHVERRADLSDAANLADEPAAPETAAFDFVAINNQRNRNRRRSLWSDFRDRQ